MDLMELTCREYTDRLSSKSPVPGGGGTAALAGALAAALGSMVGALTVGKKKYADVETEIRKLMEESDAVRKDLLNLAQRDAEAFEPLSRAYGLPRETEEEKAERERVMEKCLKGAAQVPFQIMERCCGCLQMIGVFAEKGSRLAVSDAGCAAALAEAAIRSAALNVYINTRMMADRAYADDLNARTDRLLDESCQKAQAIYEDVRRMLI